MVETERRHLQNGTSVSSFGESLRQRERVGGGIFKFAWHLAGKDNLKGLFYSLVTLCRFNGLRTLFFDDLYGLSNNGKHYKEGGALAYNGLHPHPPLVCFDNRFDDGQAQTRP